MRHRSWVGSAGVGIVCFAAGVSGCGGGAGTTTSSQSPDQVLHVVDAAAVTTAKQNSMHVSGAISEHLVNATVPGQSSGQNVDESFSMAGNVQNQPLEAKLSYSNMEINGQNATGGGPITALITPTAFYFDFPQLESEVGAPWLKMTFAELKSASGVNFQQFITQARQMQPAQYIKQLAASGDISVVGSDTISGVPTTHYAGNVPVSKLLALTESTLRSQVSTLFNSVGIKSEHLDVWIDHSGLERRVISSASGSNGSSLKLSLTFSSYGVTVDATPPPASQVKDLGALAGNPAG